MGRRARKKNKEIIGMDTDSVWYKRNAWWGKEMRKKSTKSVMKKVKANSQVKELFTPIMEDYPREFEQDIVISPATWLVPLRSLRQVQQAAEEVRRCFRNQCTIWSELKTGDCAICGSMLTTKFPDDYPDDWKFCCLCKRIAEVLTGSDGFIKHIKDSQIEKIRKKITLVG